MESFIHVAGWAPPPPARPFGGHLRSLSSVAITTADADASSAPSSPKALEARPKAPAKAPSTSALPTVHPSNGNSLFADEMSTLPDPRSRTSTPGPEGSPASPSHQPDLNEEVTTLSTKLINAINHQTQLDDTLSATRHELESANDRIRSLEAQVASQREILSGDVWVRKSAVEADKKAWEAKVADEAAKRLDTERSKKKIEQELENLTTALFEEANKMVIRAKEEAQAEHDTLQRKNDQLKAQLADSEGLFKSQQEQLYELKHVMETMTSDRDDLTNTNPTAPSSPGLARFDLRDEDRFPHDAPAASPNVDTPTPAHPTSFQHVIQPVLRFDLGAYDDFVGLARLSRKRAGSRISSGSIAGLNLPSYLGGATSSAHPSNGSTSSVNTSAQTVNSSAPQSPNTPASTASASSPSATALVTNLRDTKFFKRVLAEDIEPTLRLDAAPSLSWLARRSVLNSMTDGSLVVDPVTTHSGNSFLMNIAKPQYHPCSLCGESRKETPYLRNHRFRTSEQESAQRYPLCNYCLGRIRSTCDFLSFLRMVKDGHWRADDDDQERAAWEESVRLREQMFWARIGGGVVPCGHHATPVELEKSPRASRDEVQLDATPDEKSAQEVGQDGPENVTEQPAPALEAETRAELIVEKPQTPPEQTESAGNARNSAQSLSVNSDTGSEHSKRLSITIPGRD